MSTSSWSSNLATVYNQNLQILFFSMSLRKSLVHVVYQYSWSICSLVILDLNFFFSLEASYRYSGKLVYTLSECEVARTDKFYSCTVYISDSEPDKSNSGQFCLSYDHKNYEHKQFFSWFSITVIFNCMYSLRYKKNIYHFFHYIIL